MSRNQRVEMIQRNTAVGCSSIFSMCHLPFLCLIYGAVKW
ncbi:hypothetical protein ROSEINA2194_01604 [Roseburia inulinivorans DSM 16841]|uniref:Uncharacterized protein n=1 Tax=Roseburia inulinivorans DSM 16841 TaxID=622312 RepID=C0FS88_9FIRM|nr:hypothetical protein ROSEINA2194_01604 [Roseburia inulinivorans DSM 16841]